jgi:hypothetical protein
MKPPTTKHSDDDTEIRFIAAALTGILAAQRIRPDYKLVCREAIDAGIRTALTLDERRRRLRKRRKA